MTKSFDSKYGEYFSPDNTDNFDFLSKNEESALEVTSVVPQNVMEAYKYEKILNSGNKAPTTKTIINVKTKEDGSLVSYYGGSIQEIKFKILESINRKHKKAKKRMYNSKVKIVDLCVCLQDGCLFDLKTFILNFSDFNKYIFENIFFITPEYFIRYNKNFGFSEYKRKI